MISAEKTKNGKQSGAINVHAASKELDGVSWRRIKISQSRLSLKNRSDRMENGGNANRGENLFFRHSFVAQGLFMRIDTCSASVDRRHSRTPQFEISVIGAVRADRVHPKSRRHGPIFL